MTVHTLHGLYAITSTRYLDLEDLLTRTEKIIKGGAKLVQFREKSEEDDVIIKYGTALRELCDSFNIPLILNDHVHLVTPVKAAGVHLGEGDVSLKEARGILGSDAIIGVSCYDSMRRAVQAQEHGASYVAFGSMYPSKTKPHATRAPLSLIRSASQTLSLPIVAIGGINADNAEKIIQAGAEALAVVSSIFDAADPFQAAVEIAEKFDPKENQETPSDD